jgi:hypothetical protein
MHFKRLAAVAAFSLGLCGVVGAATPVQPAIDAASARGDGVLLVHQTCHQNVRTHGGFPHSHNQFNCGVVPAGQGGGFPGGGGGGDCHANVQRHFVPGYGSIWHRHTATCEIDPYPNQGGPVPGTGGCIKVGPLTVCP